MIRFDPLLALRVTHAYHGGPCEDFAFVLPRDTAERMRGLKLIAKPAAGALSVLFAADGDGAPLVPHAGKTLRIGLKLLNPEFGNYTELGFAPARQTALYRNRTAPGQLDASEHVALVGSLVSHTLAATVRPVTVAIEDEDGRTLRSATVADDRSGVSFDLAGLAPGMLRLEEGGAASSLYFDPELVQAGVLCLVELRLDGSFAVAPPSFEIAFAARSEILKYYLVARSEELGQLGVADAGFADDGRPEVRFTRVSADGLTADDLPRALLERDGAGVVLFKSQAPVARRARGRRKIQVSRNGDVVIEHLPQPGAGKTDANLIVHVSKP